MVIVPVDQIHGFRDFSFDIFRDYGFRVIITHILIAHTEVHVRPDHRLQFILFADFGNLVQMTIENFEPALVTELGEYGGNTGSH